MLASFRQILAAQEKVETGKIPVRFVGVGSYSLDVEADASAMTRRLRRVHRAPRRELLIQMLQAVEHAGTALAVPIQESFGGGKS